jgi:small GTP-binding protein
MLSFLVSILNCLAIPPFFVASEEEKVSTPTYRVHMLGLDAAGKTTMMYRLKQNEIVSTLPTYGYNVETINHGNTNLTLWEVGGNDRVRPLWRYEFPNTHAIIYVVDAVFDQRRLFPSSEVKKKHSMLVHESVQEELFAMLQEDNLKQCVILIYLNKQDLPNAMDASSFDAAFQISNGKKDSSSLFFQRKVYIQPCSVMTGEGLHEGLDWLCNELRHSPGTT